MKKKILMWKYKDLIVNAWNKSDARAILKKLLGLKRLPVGAKIERELKCLMQEN